MTQLEGIYLKKEDKSKRKFGIREKTLLSIFLFTFLMIFLSAYLIKIYLQVLAIYLERIGLEEICFIEQ